METWELQNRIRDAENKIVSIVSGQIPKSDIEKIRDVLKNLRELLNRS